MSKIGASWGWFAVIAAVSVLFLLARAARWTEGVTIDDTFTLLLGALPFAGFYLFDAFVSRGAVPFHLSLLAWVFTLLIFLVIRLTPSVYYLEKHVGLGDWNEDFARLLYSAAYALAGTTLAAALCRRRLAWRMAPYLATVWIALAIYLWLFVYLLPPSLSSRQGIGSFIAANSVGSNCFPVSLKWSMNIRALA